MTAKLPQIVFPDLVFIAEQRVYKQAPYQCSIVLLCSYTNIFQSIFSSFLMQI